LRRVSTGGWVGGGLSTGWGRGWWGDCRLSSLDGMTQALPSQTANLADMQSDAISRRQAGIAGLSLDEMRNRERSGRWQRRYRAVYVAHSGPLTRDTELFAALLRAGEGATLSHQTAAERHGLLDEPSALIHVTVPSGRHPARHRDIPGVVIHRSCHLDQTRHPAMNPPCTRVEDTVLDLVESSGSFDEAYQWLCRAVGRRRTTAQRLVVVMAARKKMRWRAQITVALGEVGAGILSSLERRYVREVERPHGLPSARRQARVRQETGNRYLDNLYEEYGVCVELDGTAAHPADEQWRDKRRDNWNLVQNDIVTIRLGVRDLGVAACRTAHDVAARLRLSGWPGLPHPCRTPTCPLRAEPLP